MLGARQKLLDHVKQSATDALKTTPKRVIQKTAEVTGDLIGNKIANKIGNVSKKSQQNNSERVTNDNDKEIPKERYISPEKRQEIIDDLRLKKYQKITKVSKNCHQNNSETATNENNKEIPKGKYISPEERQKIIDNYGINIIV